MMQRGITHTAARTIRFFVLAVLAPVLAMGALTACGGGNSAANNGGGISTVANDGGSSATTDSSGGSTTDAGGSGAVTGTIAWPDGHPAANASVFFYNYDPGFSASSGWYDGKYEVQQLPADGSYSLSGCPCKDLTAYLYVPATSGGQDCWIIMQDGNQDYAGRQASPGDTINWQALDMPCSPTWYTSDQPAVQSESTAVLPSLNSGSWQSAEARTSG